MISYHPAAADPKKPFLYASGFRTVDTNDPVRLAQGISRYVWSGIVWEDGRRASRYFCFSDWCVLDFDTPEMPLAQALNVFCDCVHIIGTTKSHQKSKNGVVCDRYRVAIPWVDRILDEETYRYNIARLVDNYPIDKACKDAGRYFFPCQEIVSVVSDGYRQEVREVRKVLGRGRTRPNGIPIWVSRTLKTVIPEGERNATVFKIAKDLLRTQMDMATVLEKIKTAPTYKDILTPPIERELHATVLSAGRSLDRES